MQDDLKRYAKKKLMRFILFPLRILPVKKNRVFMYNSLSKYACNPKYLTEYFLRKYPNHIEIIYNVKNPRIKKKLESRGVVCVKTNSLKYFIYSITSHVLVTNSGGFSYIPLKKKQIVINTHHGGGAYKMAGLDVYGDTKIFRKDLLLTSRQTTKFLSTNRKFTKYISKALLIPENKFWEIGMPRNDILINKDKSHVEYLRNKIGLKPEEKLVLYAPTYRKIDNNYFKDSIAIDYDIDIHILCNVLQSRFSGNWRFAYRLHSVISNINKEKSTNEALDLTDYEDMQELLLIADVLISDFSSSIWDFMLMKKPCFLYAKDMDKYIKTTRVYTPIEEWPFPKAKSNVELFNNIINFDEEQYRKDIQKHYQALGGCETGRATEIVGDYILKTLYNHV